MSKQGFGTEERNDVTLRAGETATLKVKLLVGTEKTEVTVYGTTEGVRADPQIGRRLDSATIDETPILGRKITTLPLFNSAFRQGKGTGDLFVNATYFITGSGSRRTTTFMLDGASNDEGWGRQTMLDDRAGRRRSGSRGADERVLRRVRLDGRPGDEHRDQVRHQRRARRSDLPRASRRAAGEDILDRRATARRRCRRARRRARSSRSILRICRTS